MSRPSDWSPLGQYSDPVPGEPEEVRKHAAHYNAVAEAIFTAGTRLQSIADYQTSESEFVNQFREKATKVASDIQKAYQRYNSVGTATAAYAGPLETAQSDADAALITARNARDDANTAQAQISHYQHELMYNSGSLTDAEKQDYTHKLQHYQAEYNSHEQTITAAKHALQNAIDDRDKAAQRAISLISETQDTGGISDSGWEQFWDKYGESIVFWVGAIAAVLIVVIAFIPILGEIEMALILIISAIVAVVTIMKAVTQMSTGKEPIWEGVLEIGLSLLPIKGGSFAEAAGKAGLEEVTKAAATTSIKSAAAQGITGVTKPIATEAIKGATEVVPATLKNVLRAAVRDQANTIARIQQVGKLELTVGGASERVAAIAKSASHIPFYPSAPLEFAMDQGIEHGSKWVAENVFGAKG